MKKVAIRSFGCSANLHDAELMAGMLTGQGHHLTEREEDADTIILNICTVKGDAKSLKEIRRMKEAHPKAQLLITGCITDRIVQGVKAVDDQISLLDTHHIDHIPAAIAGKQLIEVTGANTGRIEKIRIPKIRKNNAVHIILISEGCLNRCSFCSTRLIKGKVHSYPKEAILEEVREAVFNGAKEIWLTSQDNGAYGLDLYKQFEFGRLCKEIGNLRGTFWTRLGMANPDNIRKVLPDLLEAYKAKNIFRFIHIPLQSGNDRILKAMNRTYRVNDYVNLVKTLKKAYPDITIATDIIVGFPGETEEEFQDTLRIVEETRTPVINISRYVEREGTPAAEMEQLHGRERKRRSRILTGLYERISREENAKWLGWKGTVLIDEKGKDKTWVGRNYAYKPVVVKGNHKLGDIIEVRITDTTTFDLRGEVLD
ncbi:MAG: tRNA (N(6)-L-threonylcarbamoyladenosine(37)-C(2))-methylthiotransferase [DPANN group archaeon]|nr:tRNA (N(6)-L-threonylcarbamoyladenosine(37)-C(2))-methylthiotransferase [DPANN group archaeon]